MREFLKEIFTLRTVYIDKGRGRWATRKRLHPFMRGLLSFILISVLGIVYIKSGNVLPNEAVAKISEVPEVKTVKLIEPEIIQENFPPAQPKVQEPKPILISVNNKENKDKI